MEAQFEVLRKNQQFIQVYKNPSHNFFSHYHDLMEVFIAKSNCNYNISINDKDYNLNDGQILVIDSFSIHKYNLTKYNKNEVGYVILIPTLYLKNFNIQRKNAKIINPLINNAELCDNLISIILNYIIGTNVSERIKHAGIDLLLACLYENLQFSEKEKTAVDGSLARQIISYIQTNFQNNISRDTIAKEFAYTNTYISHVFSQYVHIGISEYINITRLNYIKQILYEGTSKTITEIIFDAGFKSLQTYYRAKAKHNQAIMLVNKNFE